MPQTPRRPLFSLPGKVTLFVLALLLLGAGVAAGIAALGGDPWQPMFMIFPLGPFRRPSVYIIVFAVRTST